MTGYFQIMPLAFSLLSSQYVAKPWCAKFWLVSFLGMAFCGASPLAAETADNLATGKDSIEVFLTQQNMPFFQVVVAQGQTLYSIGRNYQVSVGEIAAINPGIDTAQLAIGLVIRIPVTTLNFKAVSEQSGTVQGIPAWYRVRQGDNWFRIARVYFPGDMEAMKSLNAHAADNLQPGQLIQVGWILSMHRQETRQTATQYRFPANINRNQVDRLESYRIIYEHQLDGSQSFKRAGAAWSDESIPDNMLGDDFFVFINGVPEQSIVMIRNPLTRRVVYARVLGPMRRLGVPDHVEVVLAPQVATMLEAHHRRFFVEITGILPKN